MKIVLILLMFPFCAMVDTVSLHQDEFKKEEVQIPVIYFSNESQRSMVSAKY